MESIFFTKQGLRNWLCGQCKAMDTLLNISLFVLLVPLSCFYTRDYMVSAQNALQRRSCRWNQITILKPTGAECLDCSECPAGQGLVPQCGSRITADVSVECVYCQKGEGYSDKHDISSCKPCTICDPNEETISPCTATKNAKCGKCNSGYYRAESGDCHPCSWCCADSKEGDKEQQCIEQTNLPVNQVCRYDVNTIKCAPPKNTTSDDPATSAVPSHAGTEGDVAYGMGSKKERNIILLVAISGFVALAICILIGLLYICNRKNDRPSHLKWAIIPCVNRHPTQVVSTDKPPSPIVFGRKSSTEPQMV